MVEREERKGGRWAGGEAEVEVGRGGEKREYEGSEVKKEGAGTSGGGGGWDRQDGRYGGAAKRRER